MEKKVQQYKIDVAKKLVGEIQSYDDVIFTEYRGLTVPQLVALRKELSNHGAVYRVVKNSSLRVAYRELSQEDRVGVFLKGPTALLFVKGESGAAAKALVAFAKEAPSLVLKGGLIAGEVYDKAQVIAYSALPTKIDLVAMFARVLNEPVAQLARILQAVVDKKSA
ncbi:MAG: 50S ribosomal protein L10 [Spirochaetia bacterium]